MSVDLSIVIVNWNAVGYLRACLQTLRQYVRQIAYEVIVIDHSRWDGCEAMLRAEFPSVRLLVPPGNLGFAKGNNFGYAHAAGRNILFLNPDTELRDDALQRMAGWLDTHPHTGAVGARLLNSDGSVQDSSVQAFPTLLNQMLDAQFLRRWFPRSRLWGSAEWMRSEGHAVPVDAISGACFMVRRDAFEAAGRFSEGYFMYSDDLDLSYKIHRAGYAVECLTDCEVIHHGGRSSSQRSGCFADIAQRTSMAQFLRATRGARYAAAYRATTFLMACLRLLLALVALPFVKRLRQEQWHDTLLRWRHILLWSIGLERVCEVP